MLKLRFFFFLPALLLLSCSSSNKMDAPSDGLSINYSSRSALMNSEMNITLQDSQLQAKLRTGNSVSEEKFDLEPAELVELKAKLKSTNFETVKLPKPEKLLDAPEEKLEITNRGKVTSFVLTNVKTLPDEVKSLRSLLFQLAAMKSEKVKQELGY